MKYYIYSSGRGTYKLKIKDIKKMVAVAFNYCGDAYAIDDNASEAKIGSPHTILYFSSLIASFFKGCPIKILFILFDIVSPLGRFVLIITFLENINT
jgi:hypothetical protein